MNSNPPFASKLPPMCNAWLFLNEDEPSGTNYNDPNSLYQRLINEKVYLSIDVLNLCFVDIVPTSSETFPTGDGSGHTLFLDHVNHPAGNGQTAPTNQDYMEWIVRDAKRVNPNIKVCLTLLYNKEHLISQIFPDPNNPDQASAEAFAKNVVAYLEHYGLDGFDIDWEWGEGHPGLSDDTTPAQFKATFSAIGQAFKQAGLLLTMGPATTQNLDADTVNQYFDVIAFQMYYSTSLPSDFVGIGVEPDAFAYGAKFEATSRINHPTGKEPGFQTAAEALAGMQDFGFKAVTTWRMNSQNYIFEQDQQVALAKLVRGG